MPHPPLPRVVSVFLVDDHPIMLLGLKELISAETDMQVCGMAGTRIDARQAIRDTCPDIAVIDIALPDGSGLDLVEELRREGSSCRFLMLSMHDEAFYAPRALAAGAQGYVDKANGDEEVVVAIRTILEDGYHVSPRVSSGLLSKMFDKGAKETTVPMTVEQLSNRELEVFEMFGHALGTKEIAAKLSLSVKTVETYRHRIRQKMGIASSGQFIVRAANWVQNRTEFMPCE